MSNCREVLCFVPHLADIFLTNKLIPFPPMEIESEKEKSDGEGIRIN